MTTVRLIHEESGTRARFTATLRGVALTVEQQGADGRRRTRAREYATRKDALGAFTAAVDGQRAKGFLDLDPKPPFAAFLVEGHKHAAATVFVSRYGEVSCNACSRPVEAVRVGPAPAPPTPRAGAKKPAEPRVDDVAFQWEFVWPLAAKRRAGTVIKASALLDAVAKRIVESEDGRALDAELESTRTSAFVIELAASKLTDAARDRIGGMPSWMGAVQWPTCRRCKRPMMFLMQFDTGPMAAIASPRAGRLFVFQCANAPGSCEDWDAEGGGNAVVWQPNEAPASSVDVVPLRDLAKYNKAKEPGAWCGRLPGAWNIKYRPVDELAEPTSERFPDDRSSTIAQVLYRRELARSRVKPLASKAGGRVQWLQGEEDPSCPTCRKPMRFVAQVSAENGVAALDRWMNFGDAGVSYLFVCDAHGAARWLWQCG